jgi:D-apionolactonase
VSRRPERAEQGERSIRARRGCRTFALSESRLWLGRDEPPIAPGRVAIGSLAADLDGIDLRAISYDDVELVNRIYVSVRDTDWNTLPPEISDLVVDKTPGGVREITFQARHSGSGIDFRWRGRIAPTSDGGVSYDMNGIAEQAFRYNRIGFCVLHPASQAGRPYRARSARGEVTGSLPDLIAPQLVLDGFEVPLFPAFTALDIELPARLVARLSFVGDEFEMEDQRNWTDASFKTYCTPIGLGYPHPAEQGRTFRQRVLVSASGPSVPPSDTPGSPAKARGRRPTIAAGTSDRVVDVSIGRGEARGETWPRIGLGEPIGDAGRPMSSEDRRLLRTLGLDHIRFDLRLSDGAWASALGRAADDARSIGAALEVALFVDDGSIGSLPSAAARLESLEVARIIALFEPSAGSAVTPTAWVDRIAEAFARGDRAAPAILTGTDGDFAELNRERPGLRRAVGVSYAMNPQVHASDERSLTESLPVQGDTVRTARSFAEHRWISVSPVTLRQRFNPVAEDPAQVVGAEPLIDQRQASLFAAGWLLGSLASLTMAGANSVTYFETIGPRGVVGPAVAPHEGKPPIPAGIPFPSWFVLADLADRSAWRMVPIAPSVGPVVSAIAMRNEVELRILLANLTQVPVVARVDSVAGPTGRVRVLSAANAIDAMTAPDAFRSSGEDAQVGDRRIVVSLEPYAYARIETHFRG